MTSVKVDTTCKNGITVEGADWANGSQFTMEFFPDGTLLASDDAYPASTFNYRLVSANTFEASDTTESQICLTYGYAIAGDTLTVQIIDNSCPATHTGRPEAPLLDQIALTVLFETSSFTREP